MSKMSGEMEPRRATLRSRTFGLGLATLATGFALADSIASDTSIRRGFDQALAMRPTPSRPHDPRLTTGFDAAAVHLGRHDGGNLGGVDPAAINGAGALGVLSQPPRIGERIMLTAADGRVDALEVVGTAPLPSNFDGRTAVPEPDGNAVIPPIAGARQGTAALLLVTLKSVGPVPLSSDQQPRLVRMILDISPPAVIVPEPVALRAKAL